MKLNLSTKSTKNTVKRLIQKILIITYMNKRLGSISNGNLIRPNSLFTGNYLRKIPN